MECGYKTQRGTKCEKVNQFLAVDHTVSGIIDSFPAKENVLLKAPHFANALLHPLASLRIHCITELWSFKVIPRLRDSVFHFAQRSLPIGFNFGKVSDIT